MSTRRLGSSAASACGMLLAVMSACSMLGVGPRYLGVLGVAADGVTLSFGIALLDRRAGRYPAPRWVPVTRLVGVLLMNLSALAGVIALLAAALPRVRARTHGDVDLSPTSATSQSPRRGDAGQPRFGDSEPRFNRGGTHGIVPAPGRPLRGHE